MLASCYKEVSRGRETLDLYCILYVCVSVCLVIRHVFTMLCYLSCRIQVNGMLPEKIIVFRDGVGDGDMKMVSDFEIPQFFEGFSMFGKTNGVAVEIVLSS